MTNITKNPARASLANFEEYHSKNPQVYEKFCSTALSLISQGQKKLSAKMIVEHVRCFYRLKTDSQVFRINNSFTSYYSRLFVRDNPQYSNMFERRKMKSHSGPVNPAPRNLFENY